MLRRLAVLMVLAGCAGSTTGPGTGSGGSGGGGGSGGSGGESQAVEVCDNFLDDDGNGLADCADPACATSAHCPFCGDGIQAGGEACDGSDLNNKTCTALGFNGGGGVRCKPDCTFDTTGCSRHEVCESPGDEDLNGLSDCGDPACSGDDSCLSLTVDALPPSPHVFSLLALTFHAADGMGTALTGKPVRLEAPASLAAPIDVLTDATGTARFSLHLGRQAGTQHLTAILDGGRVSRVVDIEASESPAGTIQTILDTDRLTGTDDTGPSVAAHVGAPTGVQVASDGTVYVSEACRVLAIAPDGTLSRVAGDGFCGTAPPDGDAHDASLTVDGIALDEPGGRLYLADRAVGLVRFVDLHTGRLDVLAGGGATSVVDPKLTVATDAKLDPASLAVAPDGTVGVTDVRTQSVVSIEPVGKILTVLRTASKLSGTDCGALSLTACAGGCEMQFDAAGTAFVSGFICGTDALATGAGVPSTTGVVRLPPSSLDPAVRLAGHFPGVLPRSVSAEQAELPGVNAMVFDPSGNLVLAAGDDLLRIDSITGHADRIGGAGLPSFAGEDEPVALARFHTPSALAFGPNGDFYVADTGNKTLRRVVGLGAGSAVHHLEIVSGDKQTGYLAQTLASPFRVKVTDSAGAPVAGVRVLVQPQAPGLSAGPAVLTDGTGTADLQGRLGLPKGSAAYAVMLAGIHQAPPADPSVTFQATAIEPPSGTIFTAAGGGMAAFTSKVDPGHPIPAPGAPVFVTHAIATADGAVYLSSLTQILRLNADGTLSAVIGNGAYAASTVGGQATATSFQIMDMALDVAGGVFYVAEQADIRRIDLATGIVQAFAGPGGGMDGDGDGGSALRATFGGISRIARDDQGAMYVGSNTGALRRIDPDTGKIGSFLAPAACDMGGTFMGTVTALHWVGDQLWMAGTACPDQAGTLFRRDPDGSLQLFPDPATSIAEAADGNLLVLNYATLVEFDPATGNTTPVAGLKDRMTGGDYGPAVDAGLGFGLGVTRDSNGRVLITDATLRMIW